MIYLRGPRILFLKPEKVAGTTFEIALSAFAGDDDVITRINKADETIRHHLGLKGPQNYQETSRGFHKLISGLFGKKRQVTTFSQHMTAREAREALGHKTFDDAFKMTIVRNPFDRIVSHYYWRNKRANELPDFGSWIRQHPEILNFNDRFYFIDGCDIIDLYIRFESLKEDAVDLERNFPELAGLSEYLSSVRTKDGYRPKGRHTMEYFSDDEELIASVLFLNRPHVEKFGYRPGPFN